MSGADGTFGTMTTVLAGTVMTALGGVPGYRPQALQRGRGAARIMMTVAALILGLRPRRAALPAISTRR